MRSVEKIHVVEARLMTVVIVLRLHASSFCVSRRMLATYRDTNYTFYHTFNTIIPVPSHLYDFHLTYADSRLSLYLLRLFCFIMLLPTSFFFFFFFNDPAPPEIYPLPLHDALPI